MKYQRLVYPDVYSLPYFFTDRVEFLQDGSSIEVGRFDLIISELNRTPRQLEYLASVTSAAHTPVAIVPGPPELLASTLEANSLDAARQVLSGAAHVWAYSEKIRAFIDGLYGEAIARLIPWPFDYARTASFAQNDGAGDEHHVVLGIPLRFSGTSQNFPLILRAVLLDALSSMPARERTRFRFHAYVYSDEDRQQYETTGFARDLPVRLQGKRSYRSFLRFLAGCDGVINPTAGSILGRITFLAAALNKPGIFSDNAEINSLLYPAGTVTLLDPAALRTAVGSLLTGIANGAVPPDFAPDTAAAARIGDFEANAEIMRALL